VGLVAASAILPEGPWRARGLAGQIVPGCGVAQLGNITVGIAGALIHATSGAVILLFLIRLVNRF
jgi:uncharacterized membrane protein YeaQ/YmgE (transglycosylase-associated protein family)